MFNYKKILNLFNKHRIIIIIFLLSVFFGYFWNHQFYFQPVPGGDEKQYSCIAENILVNKTYTNCGYVMSREPVYPLFIAGIYALSNFNPEAVRFVQLFIFGIISVLIYLLGARLFSKRVGLAAGLFSSLWWGFANYTGRLTREILLVFLILIIVNLLYKASGKKNNIYFVLLGLFLGLLVLTNAVAQYLIVFIFANFIFLLRKKIKARELALKIIIFVVFFALTLSPWILYNKVKYSQDKGAAIVSSSGFILTYRAHLMEILYPEMPKYFLGHLTGYYFVEKIFPSLDIRAFRENNIAVGQRQELLDRGYSLFEADKIMAKEAKSKIINAPHKYILMSSLDFLNLNSPLIPQRIFGGNSYAHFTFAQGRLPQIPDYIKGPVLVIFRLWWILFLFLAVFGLFKNIKKWEKVSWLFLIILYFNGVYSAVHAIPRYASPMYPFYIILAFVGFFMIYDKIKKRDKRDKLYEQHIKI